MLAVSSFEECVIKVWEIGRPALLHELKGHSGSISCLKQKPINYNHEDWCREDAVLASGSGDKSIIL